jgi:hypothetical protein
MCFCSSCNPPNIIETPGPGSGSANGNRDLLDGDVCCDYSPPPPPQQQYPDGLPPAANYALIGARPFDLGAMIRGDHSVPAPSSDYGAHLVARAIANTPLAHEHGFGMAFAIGLGGTVSPSSGALVHPFTILRLPSHAPRMGVNLCLKYVSNAQHPPLDPQPFGRSAMCGTRPTPPCRCSASTTNGRWIRRTALA